MYWVLSRLESGGRNGKRYMFLINGVCSYFFSGGFFYCQLHILLKYTCALARLGRLCRFFYYLGCSVEVFELD